MVQLTAAANQQFGHVGILLASPQPNAPPSRVVKEATLPCSSGWISSLRRFRTCYKSRLCLLYHCSKDRRGLFLHTSSFPRRQGSSDPFWMTVARCIACRTFHILTIKWLLELVWPGNLLTTIDLKDAYFHVVVAPKQCPVDFACVQVGVCD